MRLASNALTGLINGLPPVPWRFADVRVIHLEYIVLGITLLLPLSL
jgi:hypothetical protein